MTMPADQIDVPVKKRHHDHFGQFENLREEALRPFTVTGAPITEESASYLRERKQASSWSEKRGQERQSPPDLRVLQNRRLRQGQLSRE